MNIIPDDDKLIGKKIAQAEIGGYGIKLKFSDGSILDYSSSSDGDSCWEIIEDTKQAEKERLKPCPFCGGSNIDVRTDDGGLSWYSFCNDCGVMCGYSMTKDDVINTWNKRAVIIEDNWIPCSTGKLPDERQNVLLSFKEGKDCPHNPIQIGHLGTHDIEDNNFRYLGKQQVWYTNEYYYSNLDAVAAWMPSPKPYKEKDI